MEQDIVGAILNMTIGVHWNGTVSVMVVIRVVNFFTVIQRSVVILQAIPTVQVPMLIVETTIHLMANPVNAAMVVVMFMPVRHM
jgi:hypothetical protein